jgi:hypothetical protein
MNPFGSFAQEIHELFGYWDYLLYAIIIAAILFFKKFMGSN